MAIKDDIINTVNVIRRLSATKLDPTMQMVKGAVKWGEGIVDYGAGLIGGIGGLFNKDFQDNVANFIKYDATGEAWKGL